MKKQLDRYSTFKLLSKVWSYDGRALRLKILTTAILSIETNGSMYIETAGHHV